MNKSALKNFATSARRELLERVELQARKVGITSESIRKAQIESSDAIFIDGKQLPEKERAQRNKLIARIRDIGFDRVMEEVAYTWFNRFTALRFMEVNDYLPTKVRVLSSINSESAEPDMMKEALSLDLNLNKEYVYELKMANKNEELFKYLIIKHCNDLNRYMPFMFETIDDYTEILFPEGLLATDSCVRKMTDIEVIPESNWRKIEVIGWLYQYYIAEEKDRIFVNLKKNIKITKDTLPAATQLFTPNWIVRYLIENSLGRAWLESYPESRLKLGWKYYLGEAEQEAVVMKQLEDIRYKNVNPEEITFLDPSCGSGHILVYAFDVFYDMYLEKGYIENEIPKLILEKNLFGLEVDDRAAQLASFAITMKAREKSRRIFRNPIQLNICAIEESNWLTAEMITNIAAGNGQIKEMLHMIQNTFIDAKEYGSLLSINLMNENLLLQAFYKYVEGEFDLVEMLEKETLEGKLPLLIKQASILSKKYDIICTNPPYMGRSGMNTNLTGFLNKNYPDSKSDLFAAFIEKGFELSKDSGFNSMVTMQSWMFLSSYEKMRKNIVEQKTITTLLHMDNMVMGIAFGTAATVFRNNHTNQYKGIFTEVKYKDIQLNEKPEHFPIEENRYGALPVEKFKEIPGGPIAYWVSENVRKIFLKADRLGDISTPKQGLATCNNNLFLRGWYEVDSENIAFGMENSKAAFNSEKKWFPYNKGGGFRKWYGNNEYVVNWGNDGLDIHEYNKIPLSHRGAPVRNKEYYFKEGITWSFISSSKFGVRYSPKGFVFDVAGSSVFPPQSNIKYLTAFMTSKLAFEFLKIQNPTLNYQVGNISNLPILEPKNALDKLKIENLTIECINISKEEWNSYENSWDFQKNPLLKFSNGVNNLKTAYQMWEDFLEKQFLKLKLNEEELNRMFIEIYNMENEISPEVDEKDVTLRKANLESDIKSFISYAIGCSFGRYSLDEEGLIFAGGSINVDDYKKFSVDEDNILPILSGAYFEDDVVARFVEFVRITYSEETLEENLDFISDAIGRRNNETAREALRRYFLNDFYKDHTQLYKKRPIYWLFTSGKEKAFNSLIYMHRYDKTTLSRIRTDYLHEVQIRMDSEKNDLINIIEGDSTTKEISNAKKELISLNKKIDELKSYDEKLHHMADMQIEIDLDDGVAVNYAKFKGLVAKI